MWPHPIFSTCTNSVYETNKAIIQARLISGQYRTDFLARDSNEFGDENLLTYCLPLQEKRNFLFNVFREKSRNNVNLKNLLDTKISSSKHTITRFMIDCSTDPDVILGCQNRLFNIKDVMSLTRTFCYGIHRRRIKLLGSLNSL